MKLNELNLSKAVLGDFGTAALKQAGNRLAGNAEGNLSVKDKMAKEKFIADFIGRANTNLNSAIKSGLVDPNIKAGAPGVEEPPQQETPPQQTPPQPAQVSGEPKTPEQIRKEKLAAAGQVAQQQMANNPAPTKPGAPKSPEQIRQEKQAAATQTAQSQMAANPAPAQQTKMTPQQVAALKGRLKAGAAPTSGQSGFKNYVGGSGERMTGVDKSGAPVFKKIQRESKYSKLDYILESIINIDEAEGAQSISEYLQNMFNQYLKLPKGITDPKAKAQVKTLADAAQASYPNIKDSLAKLANLGFAISYSQGDGTTQSAGATAPTKAPSALDAIAQGVDKGLGNTSPTTAGATPNATTNDTTQSAEEPVSSAYDQVMALVGKLSSEEKKQLIATLQEPSTGGAGAFDQMGKQLQQPKTTANPVATRQQKLGKVAPGNKGAPTPDEQAKFDQLVKQKLAAQP